MERQRMEKLMDAESLVLAILDALPTHEVHGKKRIQKLAFFAVQTGTASNVRFFLHDFGPFSADVANAIDVLSYVGAVSEKEAQSVRTKRHYKVYRLADSESIEQHLPSAALNALRKLNDYSTIELEIASTIRYFIQKGYSPQAAIQETKELKPTKAATRIIERAKEALAGVDLYERGRTD
jgi:uncharacterized protein